MTTKLKRLILLIFFIFLSLSIIGCGGKTQVKKEEFDPVLYLKKADELVSKKEYEEARKLLLEIKNRESAKEYAPLAQLKIADSYLKEDEPELAIAEYRRFLELYPESTYAPYAQYSIGMAYFRQIESPERGAGTAQKALEEFLKLEKMYPRHPYGEILPLRIQKCRNIIAEGELLIGKFYYKKGSYKAAVGRFEGIVKNFPDFKNLDETLYLLADSYKKLNMPENAKEYLKILKDKFPDSNFVKKAEGLKIQ
ncbi:putative lipoprotein [Thermodesulfovibrio sp. N1]|uniref:outer membrane protein assembly factor BamD n=1 Tax=unclassified Thermodesulfovibrio TaxID=2645936 RepID=UPI00083B9C1B|nr:MULTISPECIES: outer membrane protein assembly factor BamD [unclassified Thermodesulfovibrio]MDI1471347.1 outer membrane protein assembly factor BamD [Thermodesulfovibrio sp. 1176]ODA43834.1 putative lipoprotein [Thermodesulfovibrio sp. N1]